jgi:hypothetical protein
MTVSPDWGFHGEVTTHNSPSFLRALWLSSMTTFRTRSIRDGAY